MRAVQDHRRICLQLQPKTEAYHTKNICRCLTSSVQMKPQGICLRERPQVASNHHPNWHQHAPRKHVDDSMRLIRSKVITTVSSSNLHTRETLVRTWRGNLVLTFLRHSPSLTAVKLPVTALIFTRLALFWDVRWCPTGLSVANTTRKPRFQTWFRVRTGWESSARWRRLSPRCLRIQRLCWYTRRSGCWPGQASPPCRSHPLSNHTLAPSHSSG